MGQPWGMSDDAPVTRTIAGRFAHGVSGNPSGRPTKETDELKRLARTHTAAAIETLAEIMGDRDARAQDRVAAANSLMDRGHGRPAVIDEEAVIERAIKTYVERALAARALLPAPTVVEDDDE